MAATKLDRLGVWAAILTTIAAGVVYLNNQQTAIALNTEYRIGHTQTSAEGFALITENGEGIEENALHIKENNMYIKWMYSGMVAAGIIHPMQEL